MAVISIPVIASVGIGCFIAVYHILIFTLNKSKCYLIYSFTALCISVYAFFTFKLYNSATLWESVMWQRGQICMLGLISITLIWLGKYLLLYKKLLIPVVYTAGTIIVTLIVLLFSGPFTLSPETVHVNTVGLKGYELVFFESQPGLAVHFLSAAGLFAFGFMLYLSIRYCREHNKQGIVILLGGLAVFFMAMMNDLLISLNVYSSVYLLEYGFIVLCISLTVMLALQRNYSFQQFHSLIEESPHGIAVNDPKGRFIYVNKQFVKMFGFTKDTVPDLTAWWHKAYPDPEYRKKVKESWRADTSAGDLTLTSKDNRIFTVTTETGERKEILFQYKRIGSLGLNIMEDITEKKRSEEFMIQNEKMMSIGGLAAGMAHELSNPITGIEGAASILREEIESFPKAGNAAGNDVIEGIKENIATIQNLSKRSGTLINELLRFSGSDTKQRKEIELRKLLDDVLALINTDFTLREQFGLDSIQIKSSCPDEKIVIECIEGEIKQAFFNIVSNAVQALGKSGQAAPRIFILVQAGDKNIVEVSVKDNGPGIGENTRKRIFEPFFTTKEAGIGTGLGLSAAYFIIVNNHHGAIEVNSIPGNGCEVVVRLPLPAVKKTV